MAELNTPFFGYVIKTKEEKVPEVLVPPSNTDGSSIVDSSSVHGYYNGTMDLDGSVKNENELIRRYRSIAVFPEVDSAIDEIINELIVSQDGTASVSLNLDDTKLSPGIKTKINDEFEAVLDLVDFNNKAYDIIRELYIDGRRYDYPIVDPNKPANGIVEVRQIDPRKIKKIKNIKRRKLSTGIDIVSKVEEYFLYNDKGVNDSTTTGVKLPLESVVYTPFGIIDKNTSMLLGYLHKALKPVNQLKYIEDASVIYTITRAPMKRIFYIDVGNLNKHKAEQYVQDMMAKYRNKIVYDASTGEVKDDKKHSTILEDYWMARRDGGKGTEISTLEGSQSLLTSDQLEYFKNKLMMSLNVPTSRLQNSQSSFNIGRSSEISREEIKFSKFIDRLRSNLSVFFLGLLKIQLISKGMLRVEDWEELSKNIKFDFQKDNLYAELKDMDLLQQRVNILTEIDPFVGKYYTAKWVKKNVCRLSDEEIDDLDKEIQDERKSELEFATHQGQIATNKQPEPKEPQE